VSQRLPIDNTEKLSKTNADISCGQISKQNFGRWMKKRDLAKANEDQNIVKGGGLVWR